MYSSSDAGEVDVDPSSEGASGCVAVLHPDVRNKTTSRVAASRGTTIPLKDLFFID
jgi:hypothetical protein